LKWAVYNILFALVYPFLLPGFLVRMIRRGGYAARMGDRFGLYPEAITAQLKPKPGDPKGAFDKSGHPCPPKSDFVWIHAVSVGEVQVAGQLMRAWRAVDPSVRFCFSTTSSTGWKMALREVKGEGDGERDVLIYNPLDFPNFVKSALKLVRPRAIVLTESEIWPNFIRKAKSYGIPLFLVNARVSDRSAPRYARARFFFKDVLGCFTRIFAQSDLDKARLVAAGAPAERIDVTGSFKFDVAKRNEAKERELREWIFGTSGGPRSVAAAADGREPVPPVSAAGRPGVAPYHASASAQGGPRSRAAAADGREPVPPVLVSPEAAVEREIIRLMTDDAAAHALGARAAAAVVGRQGVVPRCVAAIRKEIA